MNRRRKKFAIFITTLIKLGSKTYERIFAIEKNNKNSILPFDFKIATFHFDQSSYLHEICFVGDTLKSRGLQAGMELIKINNIDCRKRNQKNLAEILHSLNFIQIVTKHRKVMFETYLLEYFFC